MLPQVRRDVYTKTVAGSTESEKKLIKGIQVAVDSIPDGMIGNQALSDIARVVNADCFPLTLTIYSQPVIIARDFVPMAANGTALSKHENAISGSFLSVTEPCSILMHEGNVTCAVSCHFWQGYPESVLYKTKDGEYGIKRVKKVSELPSDAVTAVGGMGLLDNYDPPAEGFKKVTTNGKIQDFSDVLRKTNHTMLGVKGKHVYLCYCKNMTGAQVNAYAKKLKLDKAIMLDGGHVAAINGAESFARINRTQRQFYIVKGV